MRWKVSQDKSLLDTLLRVLSSLGLYGPGFALNPSPLIFWQVEVTDFVLGFRDWGFASPGRRIRFHVLGRWLGEPSSRHLGLYDFQAADCRITLFVMSAAALPATLILYLLQTKSLAPLRDFSVS